MPNNAIPPAAPFDIHYDAAGAGRTLILLHGIGSNSRSWRRQLEAFAARYRTVAWDAPGFGRSADPPAGAIPAMRFYAEALARLMDHLRVERAILLGHSMGGIIAQEFCRLAPERVDRLILAGTNRGGRSQPEAVRTARLEQRLRLIRSLTPADLARQRAPELLSPAAPPELVAEAVAIMAEVRPASYEFAAVAMSEADERGVVESVSAPVLLIWGAADHVTPPWSDIPANARVEIVGGAGHLCQLERPDIFNSIVLGFLDEQ